MGCALMASPFGGSRKGALVKEDLKKIFLPSFCTIHKIMADINR